jgi:hypothetical protein
MKKSLMIVLVTLLLVSLVAAPALAGKGGGGNGGGGKGGGKKNGPSGNSNVGHLYLYEKDPTTWDPVEEGAWGKMQYRLSGPKFDFVFNGHGLEPDFEYTLLYYPDPWPGSGLICLGDGVVNEFGDVHVANEVDTGDLPSEADENEGAKIWLVLTTDVDCDGRLMVGWNPTEYLFEADLIAFDDTDV